MLTKAWQQYKKSLAEGDKLTVKINKLFADGDKLRGEGNKLYAKGQLVKDYKMYYEGNKLNAEASLLRASNDKLLAESKICWCEAVIKAYGNISIEFIGNSCRLGNGEVYE